MGGYSRTIIGCVASLCLLASIGCGVTNPPTTAVQSLAGGPVGDPVVDAAVSVGPGALEQLMLERINRARLRPVDEAARFRIAIDEGIPGELNAKPRQAVAFNGTLAVAARRHADDMLANNYFAHNDLSGQTPFDRMRAAGFTFSVAGENLAWRGNTLSINLVDTIDRMHEDLFVDSSIPDRGHRKVMLTDAFREVGVSIRRGPYVQDGARYDSMMAVQDYATARNARTYFILGVVYDDRNGNGEYDFGEGTANSLVTVGDQSATTGAGGGYTFEAPAGDYTVHFITGSEQKLVVIDKNVKLDLVNGTQTVVNLGVGAL